MDTSSRNYPEIIITGAWLHDWGFDAGDRISLTKTEKCHILLKIEKPSWEWREMQRKKKLERNAAVAAAMLKRHKAAHPLLY